MFFLSRYTALAFLLLSIAFSPFPLRADDQGEIFEDEDQAAIIDENGNIRAAEPTIPTPKVAKPLLREPSRSAAASALSASEEKEEEEFED